MKVEFGPVKVTDDDGTDFLLANGGTYYNVSREIFLFMEKGIIDLMASWNKAAQDVEAQKPKK